MSAADGLARNQEDGSAILPTLTNLSLNLDLDPALDRLVIEQEQDQEHDQEHEQEPLLHSFCSLKAEPSPDKRETAERYRAEGPFQVRNAECGVWND
jgi:hypothetical protein